MLRRFIFSILAIATMTATAQTLRKYEYWVDSDYSKHTTVNNTKEDISFSISTQDQSEGVHFINFRAQNSDNDWGTINRYLYYVPEKLSANPTVVGYEYWLDGEYSQKKSVTSSSSDVSTVIDISKLTEGVHFYNFRAKNSDGVWGNLYRYLFYVPEKVNPNPTLNGYEYWLDDDYSKHISSVSSLGDVNLMIDISKLTEGVHFLNFRAKNREGVHSAIKRYLFYVPGDDAKGTSPIVGYRYGFNSLTTYVNVSERQELELNNLIIPMPTNKECASVEDGVFTIDETTNKVDMNRTSKISFSMQFKNKAGNWSSPTVEEFTQSDTISKTARQLEVQKQITFDKVSAGDYEVVKMVIPTSRTYYFRSNQSCDMQLYHNGSKIGTKISGASLKNTYNIGLDSGTYYAVIYNTVKDNANVADNVTLKLMLTDNITPTPEIKYADETVTITCAQEGANIYYTLDGKDPSDSSSKYTSPFKLTHNATIKAIALYSDLAESNIASYTVNSYKVAAPTIEFANLKVYISTTTPEAKIYYTIDGSDPATNGKLYTDAIEVNQNCTVKAVGKLDGYNNSDVTSKYVDVDNVTCATPTFSQSGTLLTISSLTDGATIYYTTDGTTPTTSSSKYTSAITLTKNVTVKAIAVKSGQITSPVGTYVVNTFQAEQPTFSFANNTLAISCTTPGAVMYYTIGGSTPTTSSEKYTKPIVLTDNQPVKAFAVADGFNNSDVATYTPTTFACDDVNIGYDGRTITMTAQDGITIYYTMDGNEPCITSSVYSGSILLDGLYTIKAVAVKANMNKSNVVTYETPCYYNGGLLRMAKAGTISKAFEWCGVDSIDHVLIRGEVNDVDLKFIGTMPAMNRVSLGIATIEGNELKDNIFENSKFCSIVLPSSITKCGKNLFTGNKRLCAVKWNAEMAIPAEALNGINNPNFLLYVQSKSYAPSNIQNVVVNFTAESIVLKDNYDFYASDSFTATKISYTHNYSMQTVKGVCRGWESIALPFDVSKITHATNGEIAPFAKNVADAKPFWLYELDENKGFVKASDIKANTPYIISMPNNSDYADDYILAGDVTFSGENVEVPSTSEVTVSYGGFTYTPCFQGISNSESIYPINVNQEYNGYPEGSLFVANLRNVKPFEAYMNREATSRAKAFIPIFDNSTDGIDDIISDDNSFRVWSENHKLYIYSVTQQTVRLYTSSGQLVKNIDIINGINTVNGISDGIYIVKGVKVFVR